MRLLLTPGQSSDKIAMPALLDELPVPDALVADRGYDSDAVIALVRQRGSARISPARRAAGSTGRSTPTSTASAAAS